MTEHFRKLENMYLSAPINRFYGPTLKIARGESELRMTIRPEFFHAAGAMHGSVYFKAADDTAFFAVNSLVEDVFVLTSTFTIYLRPGLLAGAPFGVEFLFVAVGLRHTSASSTPRGGTSGGLCTGLPATRRPRPGPRRRRRTAIGALAGAIGATR